MINFEERPILVFWESTRACSLACKHCRAEAVLNPSPGELSTSEALAFVESLISFGRPYPVLIFTGGDILMRSDAFLLARRARELGIPFGMAPSVTPRMTEACLYDMRDAGVKVVSVSLDGACEVTHDGIRGVSGHFRQTINMLYKLVELGFAVQVNTTVMRENVEELPRIVELLKTIGVRIWEVFFLIHVGRGREASELSASECEDVCHFLFESSTYDLTVRTVEAPFFRRVVLERTMRTNAPVDTLPATADNLHLGNLYRQLSVELRNRLGPPRSSPAAQTSGTRDGNGIIFVACDGTVYPAGFLPLELGNIRQRQLSDIYRDNSLLRDIRSARFTGRCGTCGYRHLCGGSRSRAYAKTMDPLAEDPACLFGARPGSPPTAQRDGLAEWSDIIQA